MDHLKFLTFVLFLSFFQYSYAQDTKLGYGLLSGVSLNNNSFDLDFPEDYLDYSFSSEYRATIAVGAFVNSIFARNFGLKLMGNYANKGGKTNVSLTSSNNVTAVQRSYVSSLEYFQFSLIPEFLIPFEETTQSSVHFSAGGYYSFLLSASEKFTTDNSLSMEYTIQRDIMDELSGSDAGLVFGAGLNYRHFLLEIIYNLGLSNIVKDESEQSIMNSKNNSISILIGWSGGY